jgi:hypothetical protein
MRMEIELLPRLRTIERVLNRRGLTHPRRDRASPNEPTDYYPAPVVNGPNDVHAIDIVSRRILGGEKVSSFHLLDLARHYPLVRQYPDKSADSAKHLLVTVWQTVGLSQLLQYSFIGQIDAASSDIWLAALDVQRIASRWTAVEVGLSQLIELAPRCQDWLTIVGGCEYSIPLSVACLAQVEHLSGVFRFPTGDLQVWSNRKLYGKPPPYAGFGHPRWHDSPFRLNDARTWWTPDEEQSWTETDAQGRT